MKDLKPIRPVPGAVARPACKKRCRDFHRPRLSGAAWLLSVLLLLALVTSAHAQVVTGSTSDGVLWSASNSQVTITGYSGTGGAVSISGTISVSGTNMPVTGIGNNAFASHPLTSVTIPDGVTSIGSASFEGCTRLTSVTIPGSVTTIGQAAFFYCSSLTSVSIPSGVISIGQQAFEDCSSLTGVSIPSSVTSIGNFAFQNCGNLTSIAVAAQNSAYSSTNGVLFNYQGTALIQCPGGKTGSYTVPNGVTSIGQDAFADCNNLTSVSIGNGVTSIAAYAFADCGSLTGVTIPNGVTSIAAYAFANCGGLTNITIPNGVTSIGTESFYGCTSLAGVMISNSVTTIGIDAFYGCTSLTGVTIPNSVTSIGTDAFGSCSSLQSAVFMGNAPSLGAQAFYQTASGFTVYYRSSATGFTTPTWNGYQAASMVSPTVTTGTATGTVYVGTTLNGTIDPNGLATICYFQYGLDTTYGSTTGTQSVGSGTAGVPISAAVTGLTNATSYHYQLVATNMSGTFHGSDQTFTTLSPPPAVTTGSATGTLYNATTLNGTVNPGGLSTTCYFQYGLTGTYGATTTAQPAGSGTTAIPENTPVTGLAAETIYHFQLVAANSSGTTHGSDQTFTTANPPPTVTTGAPTGTVYNGTIVNGTVNPNGLATTYYVQYGPDATYGNLATTQPAGSGVGAASLSVAISGLNPAATYHYQIVAANSSGTTYGSDLTFTTADPPPTVITGTASGTLYNATTLNGTIDPNGLATTYWFLYGLDSTYGNTTAAQAAGSGSSAASFSAAITGLSAQTLYHYQLVAANSSGTSYGLDQTFVTQQSVLSWVAPTGYQNSMLVFAQVQNDGQPIATGSGSMLAAFANGTCAGVAQVVSSPAGPAFQLQIWSNQTSMNGLTLQVFDAATGIVSSISETLNFVADTEIGTITAPVVYQAGSSLIVSVVPNWNWISFNVLPITSGSTDNSVSGALAGYNAQTNDVIKSVNGSATYADGQWWPSPGFTIDPDWMYKLQSTGTTPQQFSVSGTAVDATAPITLVSGWNWIGYKLQQGQTASAALSGLQASPNDLVKSPDGSAAYASGQWWLSPSGYQMVPGKGYMLNVVVAQSFSYQQAGSHMAARMLAAASSEDKPDWQTPSGRQYSMIVYAVVTNASGQTAATGSGSMLAAFINGTCAGVVQVGNGPGGALFQLQVWSNQISVSGMTLEVYDMATETVSNITQLLNFADNSSVGSILSPATYAEAAPSSPPTVTTGTANATRYDGSTLNETVDPNGLATTCYFQYGTTTAFGSTTTPQSIGSGTVAVPVSAVVAGLSPATTYYYQLVTTSSGGTAYSSVQRFTTTQAPTPQIAQSGNDIQISLQSLAGCSYQLQRATLLSGTDNWQAIGTAQQGTGNVLVFVDSGGILLNEAFYRVQISQ